MNLTMKKLAVLVLATGLFCGASFPAEAKEGKGHGAMRYMEQLSPEQQSQARAIFEEGRSANQSLREQIAAKKAELSQIMKSANPDSARIEALSKEIGQLRGKEMLARMDTVEKLKKAGFPEMKKPDSEERKGDFKRGDAQEFANKRIARLPEAKQADARKIFDEYQAATSQTREALKINKTELRKAMDGGDTAAVESLSATMGELKGKLNVARVELRKNLEKANIPADVFDRDVKKDGKKGKRSKDGRHGKGKKDRD